MDREERQLHIDMAERFVAEGLAQIEKQRRLIQDLEGSGGDASRAQALLTTLLESQGRYERHRDRLQRELALQPEEAPAPLPNEAPAPVPNEESPELAQHATDDPEKEAPVLLLNEESPELARHVADDPEKEAPAPLLNEESPELARHVADDPQDDSDRSPQAAVDQEAKRWMQVDSGEQKREP